MSGVPDDTQYAEHEGQTIDANAEVAPQIDVESLGCKLGQSA